LRTSTASTVEKATISVVAGKTALGDGKLIPEDAVRKMVTLPCPAARP